MPEATDEHEAQAHVERTVVRSAMSDDIGGMLWVSAACGVFAGLFLGGSAGTLVGASHLEHHEHAVRERERHQREAAISR
jgi:hypothetical protein